MKMWEFRRRKPVLTGTHSTARPGDFPIGSLKSRAAARRKLESLGGEVAPNISIGFCEPGERNPDGTLGAPVKVDANYAVIEGGNLDGRYIEVDRLADESLDEFEVRVMKIMAESRGWGLPRTALFERIDQTQPHPTRSAYW
jgi:hypothetical protein